MVLKNKFIFSPPVLLFLPPTWVAFSFFQNSLFHGNMILLSPQKIQRKIVFVVLFTTQWGHVSVMLLELFFCCVFFIYLKKVFNEKNENLLLYIVITD